VADSGRGGGGFLVGRPADGRVVGRAILEVAALDVRSLDTARGIIHPPRVRRERSRPPARTKTQPNVFAGTVVRSRRTATII
jgi:hypothetical protein